MSGIRLEDEVVVVNKEYITSVNWDDMKDGDVKFEMEAKDGNYNISFLTKHRKYTIRIEKSEEDDDLRRITVDVVKRLRNPKCRFIYEAYTGIVFEKIVDNLLEVSYNEHDTRLSIRVGNNKSKNDISFCITNEQLIYTEDASEVFL